MYYDWNNEEIDFKFKVIDNGFTHKTFTEYLDEIKKKVDKEIEEEINKPIKMEEMRFTYDDEYADYYMHKLDFCGCGCPQVALDAVAKILFTLKEWSMFTYSYERKAKRFEDWFGCDARDFDSPACGLLLSVLYMLDDKGFTEHGSSIFGCWLTEDGERLLWSIVKDKKIYEEA